MRLTGTHDEARGLLRTHAWLVVLATLVAVGAAFLAVQAKPVTYTATAEVVVSPTQTDTNPIQPDMGTERAIARSGVVVLAGATELGEDPATVTRNLSVSVVLESFVLRISYTAGSPDDAVRGASVLARAYIDYRNAQASHATTLVTPPAVPGSGSRGSLPIYLVVGLVVGLCVGAAAAWLWDRASDRVRSAAELHTLSGLPILARVRRWQSTRHPLPPEGAAREPFAFVAARLTSITGHGKGKTVVVTSPRDGAGTTSVACGVAAALAAQGKRVVLVAASSGGVGAGEVLGATTTDGLTQLVARGCSPELALHPTGVRNLSVVPLGGPNGARLELEDLHLVLEKLERRAFVVIDAPPVRSSAESLLLADAADLVVLVGDLRSGTRRDVRETMALLEDLAPRLAGWVTNQPPRRWRRRRATWRADSSGAAGVVAAETDTDDVPSVTSLRDVEPRQNGREPGRPVPAGRQGRPQPGKKLLDTPRTGTPQPDAGRPARGPGAAARPR